MSGIACNCLCYKNAFYLPDVCVCAVMISFKIACEWIAQRCIFTDEINFYSLIKDLLCNFLAIHSDGLSR